MAGTSLLADHFPLALKRKEAIQKRSLRLARCIRRVVRIVWRCASSCQHMVGIMCIVAIVLADREGIIGPRTAITSISRGSYISKTQIEDVVCHYETSDEEASDGGIRVTMSSCFIHCILSCIYSCSSLFLLHNIQLCNLAIYITVMAYTIIDSIDRLYVTRYEKRDYSEYFVECVFLVWINSPISTKSSDARFMKKYRSQAEL